MGKSLLRLGLPGVLLAGVLVAMLLSASINACSAASVTKPSIPQFTLAFVDASYDVPTTYSTDPYTGATVTHPGYHVQNRTVVVSVKNQPFAKYEANGQIIDLYLNIRVKGHYTQDWINIYSPSRGFLTQSNSEYTKIAYALDDNTFPFWDNFGQSGIIDFQVEALIGSVHRIINGSATDILQMAPWVFEGETSGWSNTQTITILSSAPIATPNPLPTHSTPSPSSTPQDSTTFQEITGSETFTVLCIDWVQLVILALLGVIAGALLMITVTCLRRKKQ